MVKIDITQTHDIDGAYQQVDFSDIRAKYRDPATQYAFRVLDGKMVAGYLLKLACFRHLRDLQRQGSPDFPYHYSLKECKKILKFAAIFPNVDTGEPTRLMDWQKFIFCQLMGWRNDEGGKRFSRAIVSVARGQGKTYMMAILMAYSFFVESIGLSNQDYLVASINYKQTQKIYGYIKSGLKQVTQIPPFKQLAEQGLLSVQSEQTVMKKSNNILRAISFESGQFDSYHFTTAITDEVGELTSRDKISKIISGQVKVKNRQFIMISTAYPAPNVPMHEDEQMIQQAMEQDWNRDADSFLGIIYAQDSLDETFKPETWPKSNPLLYLTEQKDVLMQGLVDKRDSDALSNNIHDFQNKNLNMWLESSVDSYLKLADIEKTKISHFDIDHKRVYIGFDYSMFSDNTAFAMIVPYEDHGQQKWFLAQHSFVPWFKAGSIEAKEKQDGINYRALAAKEFCTITSHPQGMINDDQVYHWITDYVIDHDLDVVFFGYDAFGANTMIKNLELNTTWPLESIRQRTSELKDPTKFLQRAFAEGRVTHLDDPIMAKSLTNAEIYEDKIGIQVDKAKATLKIDVVDALIDAMYQAMYHFEDFSPVNDKSKQVERMTPEAVKEWFENEDSGLMDEDW